MPVPVGPADRSLRGTSQASVCHRRCRVLHVPLAIRPVPSRVGDTGLQKPSNHVMFVRCSRAAVNPRRELTRLVDCRSSRALPRFLTAADPISAGENDSDRTDCTRRYITADGDDAFEQLDFRTKVSLGCGKRHRRLRPRTIRRHVRRGALPNRGDDRASHGQYRPKLWHRRAR